MIVIPFILLVFVTLVTLAAVCANIAVIPVLRAVESIPPRWRTYLILLIAAAPWLTGVSVLVSSLGDIAFGACDTDTYEVCLWNEDPTVISTTRALVSLPLVIALLFFAVRVTYQIWMSKRVTRALDAASLAGSDDSVRIIQGDTPIAFAGNHRVYVSHGLAEQLSPEQYQAVLLHERAHLRRHDGVVRAIASILSACYLPPLRRRLLTALELATEQACDESAASEVGREVTASAILAVERLMQTFARPHLPGFMDSLVAARVTTLLGLNKEKNHDTTLIFIVISAIVFGYLFADSLYYMTMIILYPAARY